MFTTLKKGLKPIRNAAVETLLHVTDPVHLKWHFQESNRLTKFHNRHQGESCFIIGNGPSLKQMDLSLLGKRNIFGLNKIYLLFDKYKLGLSYHVAVNPLVIEQSKANFESLDCPSFLSMRASNGVIDHQQHIYRVMTDGEIAFQPNITDIIHEGYTVTYVAMQLAFYMGFKNIFLIGVDHSFQTKGNPNEKQFLSGNDPNHFDPDYFGDKEWHLPDLEGSELAYRLANFYFNRDGRHIYDATLGGQLQVFPKLSYEEALDRCEENK